MLAAGWGLVFVLSGLGLAAANLILWHAFPNGPPSPFSDPVVWVPTGLAGLIAGGLGSWVTLGVVTIDASAYPEVSKTPKEY